MYYLITVKYLWKGQICNILEKIKKKITLKMLCRIYYFHKMEMENKNWSIIAGVSVNCKISTEMTTMHNFGAIFENKYLILNTGYKYSTKMNWRYWNIRTGYVLTGNYLWKWRYNLFRNKFRKKKCFKLKIFFIVYKLRKV